MKFRKKPVVIEAEQFDVNDGLRIKGACQCTPGHERSQSSTLEHDRSQSRFHVHTLEGVYALTHHDWIITGVKGERYPCKPDIFEMTYEPVPDFVLAEVKGNVSIQIESLNTPGEVLTPPL